MLLYIILIYPSQAPNLPITAAFSMRMNFRFYTENMPKMPPEKPKEETGGIFETLMKDKERTLILSLILLLMDEQTDNSLILALLYLLI